LELIRHVWNGSLPDGEVFADEFGIKITRHDLRTLQGLNWLNDEVINFYINLIVRRSEMRNDLPKVYAFNTFFLQNLESKGYASVKRWTRKVDVFSYDILLVPVHLGNHWCLAV
jgi:sentrin-specific protease 1